jgi:hypothetical protein
LFAGKENRDNSYRLKSKLPAMADDKFRGGKILESLAPFYFSPDI